MNIRKMSEISLLEVNLIVLTRLISSLAVLCPLIYSSF